MGRCRRELPVKGSRLLVELEPVVAARRDKSIMEATGVPVFLLLALHTISEVGREIPIGDLETRTFRRGTAISDSSMSLHRRDRDVATLATQCSIPQRIHLF
jgi:hypothetical protein